MGCGALFASPSKPVKPKSQSHDYKKNYNPANDDKDGLPLSGLLACPVLAAMYNSGLLTSLKDKVDAAKAETFDGWDKSPAYCALYDSLILEDELEQVFKGMNMDAPIAGFIIRAVCLHTDASGRIGFKIFQLHTPMDKHGEATRIRYDKVSCTGGFSQTRFDTWWNELDNNSDDEMQHEEMKAMLSSMDSSKGDLSAPNGNLFSGGLREVKWFKKSPVFSLVYLAWGGSKKDGVEKSVFESLYKGVWPNGEARLPNWIPAKSVWAELLKLLISGVS